MQTEEISWKQLTVLYLHHITHLHFAPLPLNFNPVASCTTSAFRGNLGKGCCGYPQQVNEEAVQTTPGIAFALACDGMGRLHAATSLLAMQKRVQAGNTSNEQRHQRRQSSEFKKKMEKITCHCEAV
jgi:hypothetical protein